MFHDDLILEIASENASKFSGDKTKDLDILREAIRAWYSKRMAEVKRVMIDQRIPGNISGNLRTILSDLGKQQDRLISITETDSDGIFQLLEAVRTSKTM